MSFYVGMGVALVAVGTLRLTDIAWPTKPLSVWFYVFEIAAGAALALAHIERS